MPWILERFENIVDNLAAAMREANAKASKEHPNQFKVRLRENNAWYYWMGIDDKWSPRMVDAVWVSREEAEKLVEHRLKALTKMGIMIGLARNRA